MNKMLLLLSAACLGLAVPAVFAQEAAPAAPAVAPAPAPVPSKTVDDLSPADTMMLLAMSAVGGEVQCDRLESGAEDAAPSVLGEQEYVVDLFSRLEKLNIPGNYQGYITEYLAVQRRILEEMKKPGLSEQEQTRVAESHMAEVDAIEEKYSDVIAVLMQADALIPVLLMKEGTNDVVMSFIQNEGDMLAEQGADAFNLAVTRRTSAFLRERIEALRKTVK